MDIFRLENLLNALRFKKVEPSQKAGKGERPRSSPESTDRQGDSVTISDEALIKSSIEGVSQEIQAQSNRVDAQKVSRAQEKIASGDEPPPRDVADRIVQGPDIYEELK